MNQLIIFMLVMSLMCFCLNEGAENDNILRIRNELKPGSILKVNCTSKGDTTDVKDVTFNNSVEWRFGESSFSRTIWKCLLRQGEYHHILWTAYRGANVRRFNQIRLWIAKDDAIYLEKNNGKRERMYNWNKN
ncbi:putative plant self-incompatibility S1 [Arabidopsis thaliana]